MTPIKQTTDFACSLACIESLATDKKIKRPTQGEIMQDFPEICSVGQKSADGKLLDGAVSLSDFFALIVKLSLAERFEVGFGRAFIETHRNSLADGIFLQTTHHLNGKHGGYHCWRLENIQKDNFVVVEPSKTVTEPYSLYPWDRLEIFGCVVIVCFP